MFCQTLAGQPLSLGEDVRGGDDIGYSGDTATIDLLDLVAVYSLDTTRSIDTSPLVVTTGHGSVVQSNSHNAPFMSVAPTVIREHGNRRDRQQSALAAAVWRSQINSPRVVRI